MYRIKDDKRIRQSADLICKGYTACLKASPMTAVNVSAIAQASGVSRATFYRIFDTPADVLTYICDSLSDDAIRLMETQKPKGKDENLKFMFDFLMANSDTLECLAKCNRQDMLHKSFSRMFELAIPSTVMAELDEVEKAYIRESIAAFMCGVLFIWIKKGKRESSDELISLFHKVSWHSPEV